MLFFQPFFTLRVVQTSWQFTEMANAKRPRKTTDAEADDDGMQVDLSVSDDEIQSPVVSQSPSQD